MKRVMVPGVFDVFHIGHLNYLKRASEAGDYLVVAVQEDRAVEKAKGTAMVTPLPERIALIEEIRFVDEVVSYIEVFQGELLASLRIDVFACGEEYGHDPMFPDQVRTIEFCKAHRIEVFRIPRTNHVSSTKIRSRLKAFWASRAAKEEDAPAGVTVLGSFQGDQAKIIAETRREADLILSVIKDAKDRSLLDMGCGDGRLLAELAPFFRKSTGVEYIDELLDLARKRTQNFSDKIELLSSDVTEFLAPRTFDVFLLSGIVVCLDDVQLEQFLNNIDRMMDESSRCLVRNSVGLEKRINIVNQFSPKLGDTYTGYYRTVAEIESKFLRHGWHCKDRFQLYQHCPDTAIWWFEFSR
ncbi:MAG: adenylyltransferase/cytidyltransferase family protein [Zoogloeaceae bacterium]|nr:adenylyltransferase/cytidyltransferase family protein [Zoogloeaceae bacterium]